MRGRGCRPRRDRRLRAATLALGLGVLLSGACGTAPPQPQETQRPEAASPAALPPPALSPEAYQAELTAAGDPIAAAFGQIAAAPSVSTLKAALSAAKTALLGGMDRLSSVRPPDEVRTVNAELIVGLDQLVDEVSGLAGEVETLAQCAAPAVIASIGNSAGAERLRTAAAALGSATQGPPYQWGQFLPPATPPQERSLPNGQFTHDQRGSGRGELRIFNGTDRDAVVTLSQAGVPYVSVYATRGQRATVRRIADGTYDLFYTSGVDWDEQLKTFTRSCAFARFDLPVTFATIPVGGGIQYTIQDIGLQPTPTGTATTSAVSPEDFPTA